MSDIPSLLFLYLLQWLSNFPLLQTLAKPQQSIDNLSKIIAPRSGVYNSSKYKQQTFLNPKNLY
jgi:hypothetical protein